MRKRRAKSSDGGGWRGTKHRNSWNGAFWQRTWPSALPVGCCWGWRARARNLLCQYRGLNPGGGLLTGVQCLLEGPYSLREAPANLRCAPEPRVLQQKRVLSVLEELNLLLGRAGELISLFEPWRVWFWSDLIFIERCVSVCTQESAGGAPVGFLKPGQQGGDFLCQCSETGEIWNWWNVNKPKGK